MRHLRITAALTVTVLLCGCQNTPVTRDKNDTTAPTITLTVTASANTADGIEVLAPGSNVTLKGAGGSALIKADDDKGVGWVELWMTQEKICTGTIEGPGLAGGPTKHVNGTITETSAPSSLTAGLDINLLQLAHGCTYKFEVWGKAANAATNAVQAQTTGAILTFSP